MPEALSICTCGGLNDALSLMVQNPCTGSRKLVMKGILILLCGGRGRLFGRIIAKITKTKEAMWKCQLLLLLILRSDFRERNTRRHRSVFYNLTLLRHAGEEDSNPIVKVSTLVETYYILSMTSQ